MKKKIYKKIWILLFIFFLLIALFNTGKIGNYLFGLEYYLIGIGIYWYNPWIVIYMLVILFSFGKKKYKELKRFLIGVLFCLISFDLLINYILNYNLIGSKEKILLELDYTQKIIENGIGIIPNFLLYIFNFYFSIIGIIIIILMSLLIGSSIILDIDKLLKKIIKKILGLKKKPNKSKSIKNKEKEKKNKEKEKSIVKNKVNKDEETKKNNNNNDNKKSIKFMDDLKITKKEKQSKENKNKKNKEEQNSKNIFDNELKYKKDNDLKNKISDEVLISKKEEKTSKKYDIKGIGIDNEYKTSPKEVINKNNSNYQIPSTDLLEDLNNDKKNMQKLKMDAEEDGNLLEESLKNYKLNVKIKNILIGPSITKYELVPELGVKVNKFSNLSNDLALSLAAKSVRIEAPIPGKSLIGIEVPNKIKLMVGLKKLFNSKYNNMNDKLQVALGEDITGKPVFLDIASTPHLLVAGSTGSGKSVCINTIILSILLKANPESVKMLMIDPKKVELTPYNDIPHLLSPVITDAEEASVALNKLIYEMEKRYDLFASTRTKNIKAYNQKMKNNKEEDKQLPYIVTIIDELADLMMVASNEVETAIARLAQMARAAGIHLIIATQRPSTDVITGLIKSNIPSRISFLVSSSIDSRTILDSSGAEKLLGNGDMLLSRNGSQSFERIQGAYVSDDEIIKVTDNIKNQFNPEEIKNLYANEYKELSNKSINSEIDSLFDEAVNVIITYKKASVSILQRKLKIGYNRAANIIEQMEEYNIIAKPDGNKPRRILINNIEEYEQEKEKMLKND